MASLPSISGCTNGMTSAEEDALQTIAQENERILVRELVALMFGNNDAKAVACRRNLLFLGCKVVPATLKRATVVP